MPRIQLIRDPLDFSSDRGQQIMAPMMANAMQLADTFATEIPKIRMQQDAVATEENRYQTGLKMQQEGITREQGRYDTNLQLQKDDLAFRREQAGRDTWQAVHAPRYDADGKPMTPRQGRFNPRTGEYIWNDGGTDAPADGPGGAPGGATPAMTMPSTTDRKDILGAIGAGETGVAEGALGWASNANTLRLLPESAALRMSAGRAASEAAGRGAGGDLLSVSRATTAQDIARQGTRAADAGQDALTARKGIRAAGDAAFAARGTGDAAALAAAEDAAKVATTARATAVAEQVAAKGARAALAPSGVLNKLAASFAVPRTTGTAAGVRAVGRTVGRFAAPIIEGVGLATALGAPNSEADKVMQNVSILSGISPHVYPSPDLTTPLTNYAKHPEMAELDLRLRSARVLSELAETALLRDNMSAPLFGNESLRAQDTQAKLNTGITAMRTLGSGVVDAKDISKLVGEYNGYAAAGNTDGMSETLRDFLDLVKVRLATIAPQPIQDPRGAYQQIQ